MIKKKRIHRHQHRLEWGDLIQDDHRGKRRRKVREPVLMDETASHLSCIKHKPVPRR